MTHELAPILRRISEHLNFLQDEYWESKYHAAQTSQTGVRAGTTGPSSPGNDDQLDYLNDVQERLGELAKNISEDLNLLIPHNVVVQGFWVAWIGGNQQKLHNLDWLDDLVDDLKDIETELRVKIYPTEPHEVKLPDYATAEEIGHAYGIGARAVRKYCNEHQLTAWKLDGRINYDTRAFGQARRNGTTLG